MHLKEPRSQGQTGFFPPSQAAGQRLLRTPALPAPLLVGLSAPWSSIQLLDTLNAEEETEAHERTRRAKTTEVEPIRHPVCVTSAFQKF